jgi:protein phosphatase
LIDTALGLYAVADGMGGAVAGEVAAALAVECVHEHMRAAGRRDEQTLKEAIERAHARIVATGVASGLMGMGTTLVAALDLGDQYALASVGDSRAWLLEHGELRQLTEDQTWVNEVGRPAGLSEEKLRRHPARHVLTMALGVGRSLRVQTLTVKPAPESVLLLASDGLHGPVPPEVIRQVLLQEISLEARAHLLVEAAEKAGGPDNVTVVLIGN